MAGHRLDHSRLEARHLIVIVLQMFRRAAIAFAETLAEVPPGPFFYRWVLVDLMVIGVGVTVFCKVAAGGFNAFMEATTLSVAVFVRDPIPIVIAILRDCCAGERLRSVSLSFQSAG
jgi:hypothetical protein